MKQPCCNAEPLSNREHHFQKPRCSADAAVDRSGSCAAMILVQTLSVIATSASAAFAGLHVCLLMPANP
jgi:hypothetical protein